MKPSSLVHFAQTASGNNLLPGRVYELSGLMAETVGELAGEGKRGSRVEFDVSGLSDKARFRYEEEAGHLAGAVWSVELL